jgi:hypothetical protein
MSPPTVGKTDEVSISEESKKFLLVIHTANKKALYFIAPPEHEPHTLCLNIQLSHKSLSWFYSNLLSYEPHKLQLQQYVQACLQVLPLLNDPTRNKPVFICKYGHFYMEIPKNSAQLCIRTMCIASQ